MSNYTKVANALKSIIEEHGTIAVDELTKIIQQSNPDVTEAFVYVICYTLGSFDKNYMFNRETQEITSASANIVGEANKVYTIEYPNGLVIRGPFDLVNTIVNQNYNEYPMHYSAEADKFMSWSEMHTKHIANTFAKALRLYGEELSGEALVELIKDPGFKTLYSRVNG